MLLRHRSNWVVPIASISIALEDCAWIVWRIIRLYRGNTTRKNPTGIQRYLKSLRIQFLTNSLLRICKSSLQAMMISMELLAAPARRLWSWCMLHSSSLRNFAASFQLFYHRRIFSSTFLLICNKNPLYHHDFQCLKISVRWSITLLRKPCCRSKPPPGA